MFGVGSYRLSNACRRSVGIFQKSALVGLPLLKSPTNLLVELIHELGESNDLGECSLADNQIRKVRLLDFGYPKSDLNLSGDQTAT